MANFLSLENTPSIVTHVIYEKHDGEQVVGTAYGEHEGMDLVDELEGDGSITVRQVRVADRTHIAAMLLRPEL